MLLLNKTEKNIGSDHKIHKMIKGKFTDAIQALVINFYKILMKHNGQMLGDNRIANVNLFMFL